MRETERTTVSLRLLHGIAARRAYTSDEADDLVQDVLVAALEQGRALDDPTFPAWASGVIRRRALFLARSAGRRRRREAEYAREAPSAPSHQRRLPRPFVATLSASLHVVAVLINAGLSRAEVASLLRISDTALRQRISGLRRAWRLAGVAPEHADEVILPSPNGPRRRALKTSLLKLPTGRLAISDPDGHPIFLSGAAHNPTARGN